MTKTFVLRPNALLSSANSTQKFGDDNIVVIPRSVLDEVQTRRNMSNEKAKVRRRILEYIRSFDYNELTSTGVRQSNGSILKICKNYKDIQLGDVENETTEFQRRTLQVCKGLMRDGNNVVLVTNNLLLQMTAAGLGIRAESFRDEVFPKFEDQYTGRVSIEVSEPDFNSFWNNGLSLASVPQVAQKEWCQNQFVVVKCWYKQTVDGQIDYSKAYGKVVGDKIIAINMFERNPYGVKPLNDGQRFLIEALYSDSPLVVVKGDAGTGKTFCTLAVALDELEKGKKYSRILVTRKADFSSIGYLPGEIENKMSPYLAGIKDNLAILINSDGKRKKGETYEDGEYYFESGMIQVQAIDLLRGRSIVDTLFIIDETQNIEPEMIKTIVTRAAKGSKFVFLGDPTQVDNPNLNERYNGLVYLSEKMKGIPGCDQITLLEDESVRSELARIAAKIL